PQIKPFRHFATSKGATPWRRNGSPRPDCSPSDSPRRSRPSKVARALDRQRGLSRRRDYRPQRAPRALASGSVESTSPPGACCGLVWSPRLGAAQRPGGGVNKGTGGTNQIACPRLMLGGGLLMSMIDRQRIAAVATLEALGYVFSVAEGWTAPANAATPAGLLSTAETDAMHTVLMARAGALDGCGEGSPEETELKSIVDAIEAYEAKRWPNGKEAGGKG